MGPGDGHAGGQQDQGVQERQVPDIEGLDPLRRPYPSGVLGGEQGGAEVGPEESREEHHFRGDEQRHAVAQADLHRRRVMALKGRFAHDVAPPPEHGQQQHGGADIQHPGGNIVHEQDGPDGEDKGRRGADHGPRARLDEVVGMFLFVPAGVNVRHCQLLRGTEPKSTRVNRIPAPQRGSIGRRGRRQFARTVPLLSLTSPYPTWRPVSPAPSLAALFSPAFLARKKV